jgi:hypothetical protein
MMMMARLQVVVVGKREYVNERESDREDVRRNNDR